MVFHWRLLPVRKRGLNVSHLRYASKTKIQCLTTVKLPGSFRLAAGNRHLYRYCIFTEQLLETVPWSLNLSCGPELTRQGITLPLDGYSYRRRLLALHSLSFHDKSQKPARLTFQHWSGLSPYTSSYEFAGTCVFDKQSLGVHSLRPRLSGAIHIANLRMLFCRVPSGDFTRSPWHSYASLPVLVCGTDSDHFNFL